MASRLQLRRGTKTEHESFAGQVGETTVDTTNDDLRVHDGSTVGGKSAAQGNKYDGIKQLDNAPLKDRAQYDVAGFYAGTEVGGGQFIYDASRPKADHNVGTVITPEAISAWDGTQGGLSVLLNWTGTGTGAFVRVKNQKDFTPEDFGAVVSSSLDSYLPLQKWIDNFGGRMNQGPYSTGQTLVVPSHTRMIGHSNLWSQNSRVTQINWIGASGGVVVQLADQPFGTHSTTAVFGCTLKNFSIQGNNSANIGLYANYVADGCDISGVTVRGCNLFGVLAAKMFNCYWSKIVTRNCKGIGQAYGVQYNNTFDTIAINAVVFRSIRSAQCGQKYDAVTAPTGFDFTENITGGCGIYLALSADSSVHGIQGEASYGAGLVISSDGNNPQTQIHAAYTESNMDTAVADGATSIPFGTLLYNTSGQVTQINIRGNFSTAGDDGNIYYYDNGGSTEFLFDHLYNNTIYSSVSGVIPVTVKEDSGLTIQSDAILQNKYTANYFLAKPFNGDDNGNGFSMLTSAEGISGWASGDTLTLGSFSVGGALVGRATTTTHIVTISAYAETGTTHTYRSKTYAITIMAIRRFSSQVQKHSKVTLLDELNAVEGADLLTLPDPVVTLDDTDPNNASATIDVTPTSTGDVQKNHVSLSGLSNYQSNNAERPRVSIYSFGI